MNFSARTVLMALATALLCVGAISLVLADPPCVQFAEYDNNCSYEGCDLAIYTTCGPGSNQQQCAQWWTSENQVAKFKCVTFAGAGTRCLPATGTKTCMIYVPCFYSNTQNKCVEDLLEAEICPAPYYYTTPPCPPPP